MLIAHMYSLFFVATKNVISKNRKYGEEVCLTFVRRRHTKVMVVVVQVLQIKLKRKSNLILRFSYLSK